MIVPAAVADGRQEAVFRFVAGRRFRGNAIPAASAQLLVVPDATVVIIALPLETARR